MASYYNGHGGFATDSSAYGSHQMAAGFNPDRMLNPHDVDHTGPGQFKKVGRYDPLSSSLSGGLFAPPVDERPRGNVDAVQRVKSRPTGGGDFLDRLSAAEGRDDAFNAQMHAAGARPGSGRRHAASPRPQSAYARAAKILEHHQNVADNFAEKQQQRQWNSLQKQQLLPEFRNGRASMEGGAAAGAKSRTLQIQEHALAAQQAGFQQSWQQQAQQAEAQKRAELQQLHQQNAMVQQQRAQRAALQEQQQANADALRRKGAMAMHQQHQQSMAHAQQDVAMKTQWAHGQAARRNSGSIRLG